MTYKQKSYVLRNPSWSDQKDELDIEKQHSYNCRITRLRKIEYPLLHGVTYLDHAGTTLPSKSLIRSFARELETTLLANPHSASSVSPNTSQTMVENTRLMILDLFGADKEHFDVVFVANATAGIKLVADAFSGHEKGFKYYYHRDSHTSLVGVRELTQYSHCFESDTAAERWMERGQCVENTNAERPTLFAYPAQSNMNGRRLSLSWPSALRSSDRHPNTYTLLDVAALVSTSPLDLSDHAAAPDFVVLSFYKMFGFPDLGALIVRNSAAYIFEKRKYFGGGTTEMIACMGDSWVEKKKASLHARLEDGSGAIHSIVALQFALKIHGQLFGGFDEISRHTGWLAKSLYEKLASLRHVNGRPACWIYKDPSSTYGDATTQGATIAFNTCHSDGTWIGSSEIGKMAEMRGIYIRVGTMCNPAGMASALGLDAADLRRLYETGFICGDEDDVKNGVPLGMVRVSFGAMSTLEDVEVFIAFVEEYISQESKAVITSSMKESERRSKDCELIGTVKGAGIEQRRVSRPVRWFRKRWRCGRRVAYAAKGVV